jgi:putative transposase
MSKAISRKLRSETNIGIINAQMKQKRYWSGAHTKHRMLYHIVWIPKYRKRVLIGQIATRVEELLRECAEINRWYIDELNIQRDHVHMLVRLRPDVSVSKVVQLFKGRSSYEIRREFPELKEFAWGTTKSFWSDGFFVETVGQVNEAKIREYIRNQ